MKATILIIDDDQKLNELLKSFLDDFGYLVHSATHPDQGMRKLRQASPDLVILDVMLPEMDGFEVCRLIRQTSTVPIIMLTARGELTDKVLGLELGADDYLPKPFEPRELVARIQSVLRRIGRSESLQSQSYGRLIIDFAKQIDPLRLHIWHAGEGFKAGTFHGRYFMIVERGAGRFTFEMTGRFADERHVQRLAVMFFALLALLLVLAYFAIRRILRPVRWLQEGVQQVGAGNLNHRVPLKRADEFRDLAESFNTMAERVGEMMHAKERLLLDVSHELRSPITRMKVALEFMQEGKVKASLQEDLKEMERMVSDILDTYRRFKEPGALNLQMVDVAGIIDDVVSAFGGRKPGVGVSWTYDHVYLKIDPEKIKTVLQNVIANGLKYSEDDADPVVVSLKRQTSHALIEIQDHGIGIPEEAIPYVFEPFYRLDSSRSRKTGGYGLGLSLSKAIIEAHGGRIGIQSEVGRGTTISLYLPLPS